MRSRLSCLRGHRHSRRLRHPRRPGTSEASEALCLCSLVRVLPLEVGEILSRMGCESWSRTQTGHAVRMHLRGQSFVACLLSRGRLRQVLRFPHANTGLSFCCLSPEARRLSAGLQLTRGDSHYTVPGPWMSWKMIKRGVCPAGTRIFRALLTTVLNWHWCRRCCRGRPSPLTP